MWYSSAVLLLSGILYGRRKLKTTVSTNYKMSCTVMLIPLKTIMNLKPSMLSMRRLHRRIGSGDLKI